MTLAETIITMARERARRIDVLSDILLEEDDDRELFALINDEATELVSLLAHPTEQQPTDERFDRLADDTLAFINNHELPRRNDVTISVGAMTGYAADQCKHAGFSLNETLDMLLPAATANGQTERLAQSVIRRQYTVVNDE